MRGDPARLRADAGVITVEFVLVMIAAAAMAAVLMTAVQSNTVRAALIGMIERALS